MIAVVSRQLWMMELWHLEFRRNLCCGLLDVVLLPLRYLHFALMAVIGTCALKCFGIKVVLVGPGATTADSHDKNQPCVVGGVLDMHDVWHCLSAMALAFFVMSLLQVKVHVLARKYGLGLCKDS